MPDEPRKENEEVERLAVVMVARRDQIKMAEDIIALKKQVKHLEAIIFAHLDPKNEQHRKTKARRKTCPRRSK